MKNIIAVATYDSNKKHEFEFEVSENAIDTDVVDKAFDIAYSKFANLEKVKIVREY